MQGFNIIDLAILGVFALSILAGLYRGTVATGLSLVALGLSLLIGKLCYPLISQWIAGHEVWMEWLIYLSEGSSHIPTALMEYARTDVVSLSADQVTQVIEASGFTAPFDGYLASNIAQRVYQGSYSTLFDYFNQTVADASLNIISFELCFAFTYVVSSLLITLADKTFAFPLLKAADSGVGGVLGFVRGFVVMMALVVLVPLVVNMLQISLISNMVDGSVLMKHFYLDNWFFSWIKAVL